MDWCRVEQDMWLIEKQNDYYALQNDLNEIIYPQKKWRRSSDTFMRRRRK
jgi:hypothetical protein